jgi:tripeptide aminopeptidase
VVTKAAQAGEILGIDVRLKATGGGLDANILNARGIPCLALGLGNEHPHTKDELVSIHEMEKAVEFMRSILKAKS